MKLEYCFVKLTRLGLIAGFVTLSAFSAHSTSFAQEDLDILDQQTLEDQEFESQAQSDLNDEREGRAVVRANFLGCERSRSVCERVGHARGYRNVRWAAHPRCRIQGALGCFGI